MTREPLRALVVAYAFPPVGGAGVQRVAKLVRYLPDFDVHPTVLTVSNPSVPLRDLSLEKDIPKDVSIIRTRTYEPGYGVKKAAWAASSAEKHHAPISRRVLQGAAKLGRHLLLPDPQILWLPTACAALMRHLSTSPDVVFVSGPPFSPFMLAPWARWFRRTAVVLDYRDEWSTYRSAYEMSSPWADRVGSALEHRALHCADAVTTATEAFRDALIARFPFLPAERIHTICNGYDPADFPFPLPQPTGDSFVLTYAGTVFRLTSARGLLAGIRLLHERTPELAKKLRVRFIGRVVETEADTFEGSEHVGVERVGYLEHERVIDELGRSHAVLCILDDVAGAERIYPAKIFELMHLGRPCLVLAPDGALTDLVRRHRLGTVVAPRDAAAVAEALERWLQDFERGSYRPRAESMDVERYERRALAGEFARVFREAVDLRRRNRHQVIFWPPRANRHKPTTAAALSTTNVRATRPGLPASAPIVDSK